MLSPVHVQVRDVCQTDGMLELTATWYVLRRNGEHSGQCIYTFPSISPSSRMRFHQARGIEQYCVPNSQLALSGLIMYRLKDLANGLDRNKPLFRNSAESEYKISETDTQPDDSASKCKDDPSRDRGSMHMNLAENFLIE
jgi:hypothetical protein